MTGQNIGRYKIVAKLGEGGMGEVYQAEDSTLGRTVALKFLAAHLLHDAEAKQRFLREARAAAALHHPNICTVFEVAEEGGKTFLAMAYVEGVSLEERIARGPLPLKDALEIGRQIAEGLEAAHERGVVHRDIKPANIMVDSKGRATILDFGLARLAEASKLTRADQTVGTAAYMSPEQIQGGEVGPRTDVWALGCVLYEMVAGVRLFKGQYDQALAYEILNEEPEPLTGVRSGVPMELELLVAKCLAKNAAERYQMASEAVVDLRTLERKLASGHSRIRSMGAARARESPSPPPPTRRLRSVAIAAGAVAVGLAIGFGLGRTGEPAPAITYEFDALLPENHQLHSLAFSPDGRVLVAASASATGQALWKRRMDASEFEEIPNTEGATYPFWSPDGRWIGFFADGSLKKVPVDGGAAVTLCPAPQGRGGAWNEHDVIVFSGSPFLTELSRIPAIGGRPEKIALAHSDKNGSARFPQFLPDGERFLYYYNGEDGVGVYVSSLGGADPARVLSDPSAASYLPAADDGEGKGRILIVRDDVLVEQRVDAATLETVGAPTPIADSVPPTANSGFFGFAASSSGSIAYLTRAPLERAQLAWYDRKGHEIESLGEPMGPRRVELSPTGSFVALEIDGGVAVFDLTRNLLSELAVGAGKARVPTWADDRTLYFGVDRDQIDQGRRWIARARVDARGKEETILEANDELRNPRPLGTSPNGEFLLITSQHLDGDRDVRALPLAGGEPIAVAVTRSDEKFADFSPNGEWLAFSSDQSGRTEVYVQDFPEGNRRIRVSSEGGSFPRWRSGGRELFYLALDGTITVVPIQLGQEVTASAPVALFQTRSLPVSHRNWPTYDVTADGSRILLAERIDSPRQSIRVRTGEIASAGQ